MFLAASVVGANLTAQNQTRYQVLFNRFQVPVMTLHIADADGKRERALLATPDLDYSPSFSADAPWLVFTSERDGQAEIYRVHPDGSGLERLTDHPRVRRSGRAVARRQDPGLCLDPRGWDRKHLDGNISSSKKATQPYGDSFGQLPPELVARWRMDRLHFRSRCAAGCVARDGGNTCNRPACM